MKGDTTSVAHALAGPEAEQIAAMVRRLVIEPVAEKRQPGRPAWS
jgi:hypothetical protein